MEVLVCLAQHAGETLLKEQLLQAVWPGTFVSDDALKHCISELRRVLEDDAREPKIIQTIPKRGYRLLASVEPVERVNGITDSASSGMPAPVERPVSRSARWRAGAAVVTIILLSVLVVALNRIRSASPSVVAPIRSLAVLPLQNLSPDPTQEYFSDGMTDALITELAQLGSVKVISRTSSMQYKQTRKSLPEIARELNVDGIVEGTVQRSGSRVRITAQLIQGPSDKHIWANAYDRDVQDTLALESDITEDIARHVQESLTPAKVTHILHPKSINAAALDSYFQGTYHLQSFGKGGADEEKRKAAGYFQQAIDAEPNFAPSYVGLANAHLWLLWPLPQDAEIATKAAERALDLDSNLWDAHETLGGINLASWKWSAAEEELRRAITLNPNSADAHEDLGALLMELGRLDEGYREAQTAQTLDPGSDHLLDALEQQGQFDRVIERQNEMLKIHPEDGYVHTELFRLYLKKGRYKEAGVHIDQAVILFGFPEIATAMRHARAVSGDRSAILVGLHGWEHLFSTHQVFAPVNLADVYAALGDKEHAFYWLEQAYAQHEATIASTDLGLERLNMEYLLDPLRSDPRFKDLLRRVGLPERAP
jgi:TolB-like protein/DNA-binding winged helix-turn-helix (wHTH) protein